MTTTIQLASSNFAALGDQNPLSDGGKWTTLVAGGALKILSAKCNPSVNTSFCAMNYTGFSLPKNQYSEVTISAIQSGGDIRVFARSDVGNAGATLNNYVIQILGVGASQSVNFFRFVAGAATQLGTTQTVTVTAGDVFRVECEGTTIRCKQNGTTLISVTDSNVTSGLGGIGESAGTAALTASTLWAGGGFQVVAPTFSPVAGSYVGTQNVTISSTDSAQPGYAVYYTTDGSPPTTGSTLYSTPVAVASSLTLKAIAVATDDTNSTVASAAYTITGAATPTFSPAAGTYTQVKNITISDTDSGLAGFAMYYTTDGSTPTSASTPYTTPVRVDHSLTLKALAHTTAGGDSAVGSAAYTINIPAPSNPAGGLKIAYYGGDDT